MRAAGALLAIALVGVLAAFALPRTGGAANPQLVAAVNDDYTISLVDSNGQPVTSLAPGTYDVHVHDNSAFHNFHLAGLGVDEATSVSAVESPNWTVTFAAGETYEFVCDQHPTLMTGSFTVTGATSTSTTAATTNTTTSSTTTATSPATTSVSAQSTTGGATTTPRPTTTVRRPTARKPTVKKVTVCHNGRTIKVKKSQLRRHLKHGDRRGVCRKHKRTR
jgi:hypothetical protein